MSAGNLSDLGDRVDPQRLETLWRRAKALTAFYWARGRRYPSQLRQLTVNHARKMIKELSELNAPPTTLGEFMPPHKIVGKVDDLLYRRLEACLPDIAPFLNELPSRESSPQSCLESPRGAGEVSLEPSEEAAESTPSLEVPRGTGSEGPLESSREAVHVRFVGDESPIPTITLTLVVTRRQVLSEEDSDMDEPLRIPFRLKGKGKGTATTPIELSTNEEGSDKENTVNDHPGEGWFAYDPNNPEHYVIVAEKNDEIHPAKYIRYTMMDDGV